MADAKYLSWSQVYQSLIRFVLYDTPEDSTESAVELYMRWKQQSGYVIRNPRAAAHILEYLERQKHVDRDILEYAAKISNRI